MRLRSTPKPWSLQGQHLWVKQLDMGPLSRLTFEGTINRRVTWSPDGQSLTFISNRAGQDDLWTKRADGSGSVEVVLDRESRTPEALSGTATGGTSIVNSHPSAV